MCIRDSLYADAANAKTKLENGFDLTNYDERTLAFAKDYSNQMCIRDSVLSVCPSACSHHSRIIRNLLGELAEKNLRLNEKLTHMGQRTTRAKLMSYFSAEAQRRGGYEFDIPFSRQQLADYLGVERSGLSLELGKMRDEGLLDFHKSHFLLKAPETGGLPPSAR